MAPNALVKLFPVVDEIGKDSVEIINDITMVQKVKGNHRTFKDVAEGILKTY